MTPLLAARNLSVRYRDLTILADLDFTVGDGEIVMIVGANGAGKSTLLKALFGLVPSGGTVEVRGRPVRPAAHRMVEAGIGFVPQEGRVFPDMSVEENIRIGGTGLARGLVDERFAGMRALFPSLVPKMRLRASALSGGERQMTALARSLMRSPALLLLDEPSLGLAPKVVADVFASLKDLNERLGTALVIVEHNLKTLLAVADRAVILSGGKVAREGTPKELLSTKILEDVFFGRLA